ncbi:MAG: precorrin-6A reductase [Deltaproteobacteria bacterium]|nr:precorrin-6A reductase [Deltaproteobacteria bacterium]
MILLIGGTSETGPLAQGLAEAGYTVLVSQATDVPLAIGRHPRITRRTGRLDAEGLVALGRELGIRAIVDAAHPYAAAAHAAARTAAERLGIPCLLLCRPEGLLPEKSETAIRFAAGHAEAAALAFADGRPVLLTTGSRNLAPYAAEARRTGIPLAVRVLDSPASLSACREAGIPEQRVIAGRGPFTVEENLAAIRQFSIGVIVTKESGRAGGLEAKLTAARQAGCLTVAIRRPEIPGRGLTFHDPDVLIQVLKTLPSSPLPRPSPSR